MSSFPVYPIEKDACECKLYIRGNYDSMFKAMLLKRKKMHAIFNQSTVLNESCLNESLKTCPSPVIFHPKIKSNKNYIFLFYVFINVKSFNNSSIFSL